MASLWAFWGRKNRRIRKLKQRYFLQNGAMLWHQSMALRQEKPLRIFCLEELEKATDNFNENRMVRGALRGTLYKGVLADGRAVAIRKFKVEGEINLQDSKEIIAEVVILSQINHKNIVSLLGCCLETQVPSLVYEFVSNGTLSQYIYNNNASLMLWEMRLKIAVEIARALTYLHIATSVRIVHRDIKPSIILLDENYTPKISGFGGSKLIPNDQTHVIENLYGTLGYLDPEYYHTGQLTEKSDVYNFGAVLLELLTSKRARELFMELQENYLPEEEGSQLRTILDSQLKLDENRLLDAVDGQIAKEVGEWHLLAIIRLAKRCLSPLSEERPTMKEVTIELDTLKKLMQ